MSSETPEQRGGEKGGSSCRALSSLSAATATAKQKEMVRVSRTLLILWHARQNDAAAVRKLLEEDHSLINARLRQPDSSSRGVAARLGRRRQVRS